jgi:hypothetical protein
MGAIVRVHRPNLPQEQREHLMEQIKQKTIGICREVQHESKREKNQNRMD